MPSTSPRGQTPQTIHLCRFSGHVRSVLLLPLVLLGLLGFLINTNVPFISLPFHVCHPKNNILFLKTHKCAGSSIQNILMRFGDIHNLTFVIPNSGNYLGHPVPFNRFLVPRPRFPVYNIFAHHTRLNYPELQHVMPSNTVFITIVRDPVQVFESSYAYYGLDKFFGAEFRKFVHLSPHLNTKFVNRRYHGKFGINQMLFDLGANPDIFKNDSLVNDYVDRLESWFDLVLVAERMDESLVLLRNFLCWDLNDVVTFKINARNPKFKSNLTEDEKSKLRDLNRADQILYERFLVKFDQQLESFGKDKMNQERFQLRERTQQWYDFCVKGEEPLTTPRTKAKYYSNPRVMVFEPRQDISNNTCKLLTLEELPYTDYLRQRQKALLPKPRRRFKKT